MNFKIGDKVRLVEGHPNNCGTFGMRLDKVEYFIITGFEDNIKYRYTGYTKKGIEVNSCYGCFEDEDFELYKKGKQQPIKAPKFLLRYEIDGDPIEEFETLIQIKSRIKVLMGNKAYSFKVYEIKKMWIPTVEKKEVITIKGL